MSDITNLKKSQHLTPSSLGFHKNPISHIQNALNEAFKNFYYPFEMPSFATIEFENLLLHPAIDIVDDDFHFKVEVEMPGMDEDDIDVSVNNGILTIKGEKKTSKKDKDKNYLMREISYGAYERNIRLPELSILDLDNIKATFKKGMLWVDIPKKETNSKQGQKLKVEKVQS